MLKDITVSIISGPLMTVNKSKIRAGMYLSSSENYLSPAGLMKTTPGGTFTVNEMRGGPRAVRGILVRLVMHLFWGEKYKDLWFYESFSDVGEIRVYFASKILTPCRMH